MSRNKLAESNMFKEEEKSGKNFIATFFTSFRWDSTPPLSGVVFYVTPDKDRVPPKACKKVN